ncbi:FG-GAP-like repeat-containing protein [Roseateles sp. SL47]|uniref:FG-GAP-like repeat-containing protein n=1 Tax=Roseateles sp. SL47 TaxID=2995138 RepID=UPI0022710C95|nr:FG-GAP-like repeat-containing protein [Roseateles sp. SL47]WAC74955.1 FG-GAP-like repeat-containing protein [Roseateles sp. SL47]
MLQQIGALRCAWFVLACLAGVMGSSSASAQTGVSNSGTASHTQPIVVPPGIGGMQPNLSLLYAGGGLNGPVGHGWSVQGVSMITRCMGTRSTDGQPRPVLFDSGDKLCLDGQRLIQTNASGNPLPMPQTDDAKGLTSGTWREYRTERDNYARVRAYGSTLDDPANGPQYFKVWTKAGQIYEYGTPPGSTDSNTKATVQVQGRNTVMVWAVARISDVTGNFIDFKYEQRDMAWGSGPVAGSPTLGREWNVLEIQYTGNGSTPPTNKVVFRYSDRTDDRAEAYQRGAKNLSIRRLDAIDTYVNSPNPSELGPAAGAVAVRRVRLNYELSPTTRRSRVVTIKECADVAETRCQPPMRFKYHSGTGETFSESIFSLDNFAALPLMKRDGTMGTIALDLNGDGRTDLLRWSFNAAENRAYLSELGSNGTFRESTKFNLTGEPLFSEDECYASMMGDFNGDGTPDIFRYVAPRSKSGAACSTARPTTLFLGNGDGSFTAKPISGLPQLERRILGASCNGGTVETCVWSEASNFFLLDVDGDGRLDIVLAKMPAKAYRAPAPVCPAGTACTRVFKGDGQGGFTEIATNVASQILYSSPPVGSALGEPSHVADVDGDGLPDLTGLGEVTYGYPISGWRSRGDGNFDPITVPAPCKTPIDFNGDGRADCLDTGLNNTAPIILRVSDGSSTLQTAAAFNVSSADIKGTGVGFLVIDVNGDGRDDILRWKDDPTQNRLYVSNGDGSFRVSSTFNLNVAGRNLRSSDGVNDLLFGNFDGSGDLQIMRIKDSPKVGLNAGNTIYTLLGSHEDLLTTVIAPSGQRTELTYYSPAVVAGWLAVNPYTSDRGTAQAAVWPLVDLIPGSPLVASIASDAQPGLMFQNTTNYYYQGMKSALDGRGNLGFRRMGQSQIAPNGERITVWTDYRLDEPYSGVASRTETYGPSQLLSRTVNIYCDTTSTTNPDAATEAAPCLSSSPVRRPYIRTSVESGWDLDGTPLSTVKTINSYNSYGDPTRIEVVTTGDVGGIGSQSTTTVTENTYCDPDTSGCPNRISGDAWILGRLTRAKVTNTVPKLVELLGASPGRSPTATATSGSSSSSSTPIAPAVLMTILQTLLDD